MAELINEEQLKKITSCYEFQILKGAINTLANKTEVLINGIKSNSNVLDSTLAPTAT